MIIKSAKFIISNSDLRKCPKPDKPEFAFIGRSNVGKSSLINMLVNNKKLAKTSSSPGKTQLINHFLIDEKWYLVDLPGYGYAKVSKTQRSTFSKMIRSYVTNRENLYCLFVLIDIRHSPMQIDLDFINWLGENQIPFVLVFTKSDKLAKNDISKNISNYKNQLLKAWEKLPDIFITSATQKTGKEDILNYIATILES